jgi:hypothetical protein
MIILKTDYFTTRERLTRFINENHINRNDILSIVIGHDCVFNIFFYSDDATEEVTHGLFS